MEIKPLRTEQYYEEALMEIERLIDKDVEELEPGTPGGDHLELLSILVQCALS